MPLTALKKRPIAFDADGVILDFTSAFAEAAQKATGRPMAALNGSYSLDVKFGMSRDELSRTWDEFNQGTYWQRLTPLPGAIQAIEQLQRAGFRNIHVVTAIPEQHRPARHTNFLSLGFSPEAIHCVEHTTRWSKVPPITALSPIMFVDDRIEHLHSNPQVPLLVHIDHGDEQFPDPDGLGRVDCTVSGLSHWVGQFLAAPDHWADLAHQNQLRCPSPVTAPPPRSAVRRRKP